jgi:UDP-GlcNAc:undecaprenyl-phosphate GlcNAc-1-phosphate transferase
MHPTLIDALYAFVVAGAVTAVLTPLTMRLARAVGAVDHPRERGLAERPVPLLGGLAIYAGTLVAGLIWLPASESSVSAPATSTARPAGRHARRHARHHAHRPGATGHAHRLAAAHHASRATELAGRHSLHLAHAHRALIHGATHAAAHPTAPQGVIHWYGVLLAGALITVVGAVDDRFELHASVKLAGQIVAAIMAVHFGVDVKDIAVPFVGLLNFPNVGGAITVVALVAMMNVVNFSDGVDGLAAGVSAIIAVALAVIAISLYEGHHLQSPAPAIFAALIAGGSLGFLTHNFPPARSFMGDCGANLLGLLMGCLAVEATVKTEVVISFVLPLILLTVPFLDTTFVVLKRLKYHRPIYAPDSEHFHHRMARIGFTPRRTIAYLYAWTLMLAGLALALRFIPYSDHHGHFRTGWTLVLAGLGLVVGAASVYLVYLLEILKFRRLDTLRLRLLRPTASDADIERDVERHLETGEMDAVVLPASELPNHRPHQASDPPRSPVEPPDVPVAPAP